MEQQECTPHYGLSLSLAVASIISYWLLRLLLAIGCCAVARCGLFVCVRRVISV
jgi:hypothetical protein